MPAWALGGPGRSSYSLCARQGSRWGSLMWLLMVSLARPCCATAMPSSVFRCTTCCAAFPSQWGSSRQWPWVRYVRPRVPPTPCSRSCASPQPARRSRASCSCSSTTASKVSNDNGRTRIGNESRPAPVARARAITAPFPSRSPTRSCRGRRAIRRIAAARSRWRCPLAVGRAGRAAAGLLPPDGGLGPAIPPIGIPPTMPPTGRPRAPNASTSRQRHPTGLEPLAALARGPPRLRCSLPGVPSGGARRARRSSSDHSVQGVRGDRS